MPDLIDALYMDVVLVADEILPSEEEHQKFIARRNTEVLPLQLPSSTTSLAMNKERIRVDLDPTRAAVRKEYPVVDDSEQLAEIAADYDSSKLDDPYPGILGVE